MPPGAGKMVSKWKRSSGDTISCGISVKKPQDMVWQKKEAGNSQAGDDNLTDGNRKNRKKFVHSYKRMKVTPLLWRSRSRSRRSSSQIRKAERVSSLKMENSSPGMKPRISLRFCSLPR